MELASLHAQTEAFLGRRTWKLFRFLIAGGTAAAANLALFTLFVHVWHIYYLYASIAAFVISIIVSFTMQKFWTFRDMPIHDAHMQFARYLVVVMCNLILNTALVFVMVEYFDLWSILSQASATVVIAVTGYVGYQRFVFRERPNPTTS
jgi:putative flippase GtrA